MPDPVFVGDHSFYAKVAAFEEKFLRALWRQRVHRVFIEGVEIPIIEDPTMPPNTLTIVAVKAPSDSDITYNANPKE